MKKIEKLIPFIKSYYGSTDPAHDWSHIERVASTAKQLCVGQNVNLECVLAGVYCHDLVNLPKDHPERKNASTLSAKEAYKHLIASEFSEEEIKIIQQAIVQHSFSKGLKPTCLEAAIVQDADRLDALGAIGILRCAAISNQMKGSFYHVSEPIPKERPLDDKAFMVDHYFLKLFKLPDTMNTPQGKALAQERVEFMKTFLNNLLNEIGFPHVDY